MYIDTNTISEEISLSVHFEMDGPQHTTSPSLETQDGGLLVPFVLIFEWQKVFLDHTTAPSLEARDEGSAKHEKTPV